MHDLVRRSGEIAKILGIAALYVVTALLGLLLDPVGGFATLVWAPTGIAIAATMILGFRIAPGVFLGAFVANLVSGAPPAVAAAISVGNTLEAVAAVFVLRRVKGFDDSLSRLSDVLAFVFIGAALAPLVSASIGVFTLRAAGIVPVPQTVEAFRAWWVGDFIGALLVTPLVLVWRANELRGMSRANAAEILAVAAALVVMGGVVFFAEAAPEHSTFLPAYVLFPALIWAAVRFEQRGAVTAALITSIIAIVGTVNGYGPFVRPQLRESLLQLQTFMGIVAASFLVLATAIAERVRVQGELRRALDAEARANRAKSDFIAVMSHELRTPLNAISGYAQLLAMELQGPLTDKQRDAVRRIDRNQKQLAALVEDVLGFARSEAGPLSLQLVPVHVVEAVEQLQTFVEPELRRKDISLVTTPVELSLFVLADPMKLRQILLNSLSNAIKFTGRGGRVEIGALEEGRGVRIFVRDNGVGIPADQLREVFEPFFQVERGTTRGFPGVGLGLTIARDLARAMGGEVTIESTDGQGTTVTLALPSPPPA